MRMQGKILIVGGVFITKEDPFNGRGEFVMPDVIILPWRIFTKEFLM